MSSCFHEQIWVLGLSCFAEQGLPGPTCGTEMTGCISWALGQRRGISGWWRNHCGQDSASPASREGPEGHECGTEQACLPRGAPTRLVIWLFSARLPFGWWLVPVWLKARCPVTDSPCIQHAPGRNLNSVSVTLGSVSFQTFVYALPSTHTRMYAHKCMFKRPH